MPNPARGIPVEFLRSASKESLEDFELSRLNHAALIVKRVNALLYELADECAGATVARILIEDEKLRRNPAPLQETLDFMNGPCVQPGASHLAPHRFSADAAD